MSHPPFLWGAATSSHQVEGNNQANDWWAWEEQGRIEGGVRSGNATDHWNLYRQDLQLAADLGLNSYRFSVEWSRIEPEEGVFCHEALDWYADLLGECEKLGLAPMLTLHHFTSPKWFADKGGFSSRQSCKLFSRYVKTVINHLGARVPLWCTINEPMVLTVGTYLGGFMPPGEFSPALGSLACANLLQCHVEAYDQIHTQIAKRKGPWKSWPIQAGIAHNLVALQADRAWHPIEQILARTISRFYNQAWLDAITGGPQKFYVPFLFPKARLVSEALGRKTADFIGVNYYTRGYVQWRPRDAAQEHSPNLPLGISFARRKEPASDLDWGIYPNGLMQMLRFASRYKLPILITENGIADREGTKAPHFLFKHLEICSQAIQAGIPLRGYHYWSLLDNFEWIKGFGPRFGLYRVDYESFDRTPTPVAKLFSEIIKSQPKGPDPTFFKSKRCPAFPEP